MGCRSKVMYFAHDIQFFQSNLFKDYIFCKEWAVYFDNNKHFTYV